MTDSPLVRLLHEWIPLVNLAGAWAEQVRGSLTDLGKQAAGVAETDIHSAFTAADRLVQETLLHDILESHPDITPLAEEQTALAGHAGAGERFLTVDPIDGTLAYLRGRTDSCTMLCLLDRQELLLGLVHFPAERETLVGGSTLGRLAVSYGPRDDTNPSERESFALEEQPAPLSTERRLAVHYRLFLEPHAPLAERLTRAGFELMTLSGAPETDGVRQLGSNGALLREIVAGRCLGYVGPYVALHDLAPLAAIVAGFGAVRFHDAEAPSTEAWRPRALADVIAGIAAGGSKRCRAILATDEAVLQEIETALAG